MLLVRHAEKADLPGIDPPLSCDGELRAETLVDVAGEAGVAAIYATQFIRTQQTAQPLAGHLGLAVDLITLDPANPLQYVEDVVDQVLSQHSGEVVFVVSHSNTVPLIVEELVAGPISPITEDEYDNLFIVTVPRFFGNTNIVRARYYAPTNCP